MGEPDSRAADPDVQRMLAFRGGDDRAFDALFARWAAPLLRYLERMVRDAAVAEELVQEAFLRVHRARERYTADAKFSTWLYRIGTNLALNELRRPRHRHAHTYPDDGGGGRLELAADAPAADELVHAGRLKAALEGGLDGLPERQRAALLLVVVEGLSYAEVASTLDASESSVKSLVHRARSALADRLDTSGLRTRNAGKAGNAGNAGNGSGA